MKHSFRKVMSLSKQYLTASVVATFRALVLLAHKHAKTLERSLMSHLAIINYSLNRHLTDDTTAAVDDDIPKFKNNFRHRQIFHSRVGEHA